jgi:ABC-type glutathione transport system ATPase component
MLEPMLETDTLVRIRGLTRAYVSRKGLFGPKRSMRAVNDVSLDVPRGKVTGVVGESGCGKSTLARLVLRLIEATAGTVTVNGVDLASLSARTLRRTRRDMQMVFQDPYSAIDPRYTIRRALEEPFQVQGVPLAKDAIEDLISRVGLNRA